MCDTIYQAMQLERETLAEVCDGLAQLRAGRRLLVEDMEGIVRVAEKQPRPLTQDDHERFEDLDAQQGEIAAAIRDTTQKAVGSFSESLARWDGLKNTLACEVATCPRSNVGALVGLRDAVVEHMGALRKFTE